MSIENLSPRDLVTIVTKQGQQFKAEIVSVKRDRIQLQIAGPWLTNRQSKDAKQAIPFRDLATVTRTGRAKDPYSRVREARTK